MERARCCSLLWLPRLGCVFLHRTPRALRPSAGQGKSKDCRFRLRSLRELGATRTVAQVWIGYWLSRFSWGSCLPLIFFVSPFLSAGARARWRTNGSATIRYIKKNLMARIGGLHGSSSDSRFEVPARKDHSGVGARGHAALRYGCNIPL